MKAELVGNTKGFSTLELMIAMAIMAIALVGAVGANYSAQYWSITSQTSNEGLYKAKTKLEELRALVKQDFYQAVSSPDTKSVDPADPGDTSCLAGGLCYYTQTTITDLSSCSKYAKADVSWKVSGYATTTTSLATNLTNSNEAIALGGDCILNQPAGRWDTNTPQSIGALTFNPGKIFTGIDVLHKEIYATASTSPYLLIYDIPPAAGGNPVLAGSIFVDPGAPGSGRRLNDVDVEEDLSTGRTYAFVAEHATTTQLAVVDVTDPTTPTLVTERQLQGITAPGVYSEGWKVFVYGNRLYMTTRETSGNEFHIFNINVPTQPTEIGDGYQLNRTVNDLVVREQKVGGVLRRFVFLAADADTNELSVLDVTNDTINEVASIDLPGSQDGESIFLLGRQLFFGRQSNVSGSELLVFNATDPTALSLSSLIGQGEVGADVLALTISGAYAFVGTSRAGQEFQVWSTDLATWNPSILNAGRFSSYSFSHLAPTGFDIDGDRVYAISTWKNAPGDALQVLFTP